MINLAILAAYPSSPALALPFRPPPDTPGEDCHIPFPSRSTAPEMSGPQTLVASPSSPARALLFRLPSDMDMPNILTLPNPSQSTAQGTLRSEEHTSELQSLR